MSRINIILGNQLFPIKDLPFSKEDIIFMSEDQGLCTDVKHHKSKIALFYRAMRSYRDKLRQNGFEVMYFDCEDKFKVPFLDKLGIAISSCEVSEIGIFEVEDKSFENDLNKFIKLKGYSLNTHNTKMFMDSRESFRAYVDGKKTVLMANYYKKQRKTLDILVDGNEPEGGKWSYDELNRQKLPKDYNVPYLPTIIDHEDEANICSFIKKNFEDHPGTITNIFPYTHEQAELWFDVFLRERFKDFGPYEDAITSNQHFMLHSALSSSLNMGLLTPNEVINKAISYAKENNIPLNSLEGFVRQIMGWREFIRGIYQNYSSEMTSRNFWGHQRKLKPCWYDATTGLPPLDDAIQGCNEFGYTHHINRLMILSNIMNMSGIHPDEIYKWFMEMFIDSSDWVMVPNVYGMGTYADGGVFSTKPYICGSSYILRMSNFKKGEWCDAVDGLYWQFIENNRSFFSKNPRLSLMTRSLDKIAPDRKKLIYTAAENFIKQTTYE